MEKEHEKIYRELWGYHHNIGDDTGLNSLQDAITKIIETGKKFNDNDHFRNYLKSAVKTKQIDMKGKQQRDNLISLNDKENQTDIESYQVSIPKDYYLYKWIMTQKNSKDNYLFTYKQRKVLAKRYLSEKNNVEISRELKVSSQAIDKMVKAIDRKLLSLPIKENIGSWYHGSGFYSRSDIWEVYPEIKASKVGYLKRYRRTKNPKDLDKFRNDSSRCLKAHIKNTLNPCYDPKDIDLDILESVPDNTPEYTFKKPEKITPYIQSHSVAKRIMKREQRTIDNKAPILESTQLNHIAVPFSTHRPDTLKPVKIVQDGLWAIRSAVYSINQITTV